MIREEEIKIGNRFKGLIDGSKLEIIDIYNKEIVGWQRPVYVSKTIKCRVINPQKNQREIIETNYNHFKHLLFKLYRR